MATDALCPIAIEFMSLAEVRDDLAAASTLPRVVLVASRGIVERLELTETIGVLSEKTELVWLEDDYANPTQVDIAAALETIGSQRPSQIICIGGGSAIDVGKAISALFAPAQGASIDEITRLIATKGYVESMEPIDIVAIPTTAGTGSEVTKWATVWDHAGEAKYSIDDDRLYAKRAIVCTETTLTMPPKLMLSTGLDALSHAMEAFWARPSTPLVKALSLASVREIHTHLPAALRDPQDRSARDGLCLGSILAGVAFSNTRTTACHSISYPITMRFNVPHGFAAAMTLAPVAEINKAAVPKIEQLLAVFDADGGFSAWMDSVTGLQPLRLSAFGIGEGDIETLVEMSFTAGRMNNNPVDITPEQVREILRAIL